LDSDDSGLAFAKSPNPNGSSFPIQISADSNTGPFHQIFQSYPESKPGY